MSEPAHERRHLFIRWSRLDRQWVEGLQPMIKPLLRPPGQQIQLGDEGQIQPGAQGRPGIESELAQAKVALLSVSDAALASDRASDLPSEAVRGRPVPDGLGPAALRQRLP